MLPINSKKKLRKCLFYVNIDISKHVFLLMQMPQEEKKTRSGIFFFSGLCYVMPYQYFKELVLSRCGIDGDDIRCLKSQLFT